MTYVIGDPCTDVLDKSCMDVCPVDCIYTGLRKNYINPSECIDCSACTDACPVDAIYPLRAVDHDTTKAAHRDDSRAFFDEPLPGRARALGNPGGARSLGDVGIDTAFVAAIPVRRT